MPLPLSLAFTSFVLCLLVTPLIRNAFVRCGVVDHPDGGRKIHTGPIPRVGGICIALAYVASFAIVLLPRFHASAVLTEHLPLVWKVLPGAAVVFLVGLLDDLVGLKPWQKLAGELAGAGLAAWGGIRVLTIGGHPIESTLGIAITVVWLVGCTNAFNLIDGMDGLASGIGFFATITILTAGLLHQNLPLILATAPLAGCLLAFLRYNFNPASIFLGDSGSLLIGFLLGCFGVVWTHKSVTLLGLAAPLMALSIPLLDTGLAIARRFLRLQPIFGADRDHIHHRLLRRGLKPRNVALLLYAACSVAAGLSLLQSVVREQYEGAVIVLFCLAAWVGVQNLGYVEFGIARRMLLGGGLRRMVGAQLRLISLEESLNAAASGEECWKAVRDASRAFGFSHVFLSYAGNIYHNRTGPVTADSCWNLRVPLSPNDYIEFAREFDASSDPELTAPFVELVRTKLQRKRSQIEPNRSRYMVGASAE